MTLLLLASISVDVVEDAAHDRAERVDPEGLGLPYFFRGVVRDGYDPDREH